MYYIDTPSAQIDAMDFNAGEVSNRRAVVKGFDFETTGFPDGSLAYGEEMGFFGELWPKVLGEISRKLYKDCYAQQLCWSNGGPLAPLELDGTGSPPCFDVRCAIDLEEWSGGSA